MGAMITRSTIVSTKIFRVALAPAVSQHLILLLTHYHWLEHLCQIRLQLLPLLKSLPRLLILDLLHVISDYFHARSLEVDITPRLVHFMDTLKGILGALIEECLH